MPAGELLYYAMIAEETAVTLHDGLKNPHLQADDESVWVLRQSWRWVRAAHQLPTQICELSETSLEAKRAWTNLRQPFNNCDEFDAFESAACATLAYDCGLSEVKPLLADRCLTLKGFRKIAHVG